MLNRHEGSVSHQRGKRELYNGSRMMCVCKYEEYLLYSTCTSKNKFCRCMPTTWMDIQSVGIVVLPNHAEKS